MSNKIMMEERTGGHYKISSICTYLSICFNMLIFLKTAKNIVYIYLFLYVCNKIYMYYTIAQYILYNCFVYVSNKNTGFLFTKLGQCCCYFVVHASIVSE